MFLPGFSFGAMFLGKFSSFVFFRIFSSEGLFISCLISSIYDLSFLQEVEARQCECDNCVDMKVEDETLCCIHSLSEEHTTFFNGAKCIAETRGFSFVCLEKDVLETSLGAWERLVGDRRNVCNRYRFIAYKQYIWWIYGRLGKDVRKRIPTCVLYKIRTIYPDPNNIYVPFSMS